MTTIEKQRIQKAATRQEALRAEIRATEAEFDSMDETHKRIFDQHYGECIGIEQVLALLGVPFKSVEE